MARAADRGVALPLTVSDGFAACSSPAGNEGDIVYGSVNHTMGYCNGTSWISMGTNTSISYGMLTTNDFCTATGSTAIQCTTGYTGSGNVVLASSPILISPTVSSGGLLITAGGLTVSAGGASITGTVSGTTFSGSGANLTNIGTTNMTAVTGTPSSTTYLRGDNSWSAITLGTGSLTGVVPVANGGTGDTTLTAHGLLVGEGTANVNATAVGTNGQLLLGQTGTDPLFQTMNGDVSITNTGATTVGYIGGKAVTLGGSLTTLGAYGLTLSVGATTSLALPSSGTVVATSTATPSQGDILYYNGTSWTDLVHGTNGQFLQTQGASANPQWANVSIGTGYLSGIVQPGNGGTGSQQQYLHDHSWRECVDGGGLGTASCGPG